MLAIIFGLIVASAYQGTVSYEDCKKLNFEPKACFSSEKLFKAGKFLCEKQGKSFDGNSNCIK